MEVNKVIYILLAVFLGSFGIHKFYAGKNSRIIAYSILLDYPACVSNY